MEFDAHFKIIFNKDMWFYVFKKEQEQRGRKAGLYNEMKRLP